MQGIVERRGAGLKKRVVIIGAGVGGLAAGIRLAVAGHDVRIFEKNPQVGGKLAGGRIAGLDDGYVDLGPTLLTMPEVFDELFSLADADFRSLVPLVRVDPTCRYHWSDGMVFDAFAKTDELLEEVARVFPGEREAFAAFLSDAARLFDATRETFLERPFRGLREIVTLQNMKLAPLLGRLGFTTTMHRTLKRRFSSDRLVQMLGRFATYNGSSPFYAPATLNVIAHVELACGTWYPIGGMAALRDALRDLAVSVGVAIETDAEVSAIRSGSGRRINGLTVRRENIDADVVISNVDASWTWEQLIEPAGIPTPRRIGRGARSCSGVLVTLRVRDASSGPHHEIFFSDDEAQEFADIFDEEVYPRTPTIYRSIASRSDGGLAPSRSGTEDWYLLVNVPSDGSRRMPTTFVESILARLRNFGLEFEVLAQQTQDPSWIEQQTNTPGGAIYGAASNSMISAFLRPPNHERALENLYFVGGSVHPGGGLPLVALSGRHAAELIVSRYGRG